MQFTWDDIRKLSVAERLQLVEDIWDSIAQDSGAGLPLTEAQQQDLDRRIDEYERNPSATIGWDELRERLNRPK